MSICSIHQKYNKDCKLCNISTEDIPGWNEKVAQAKKAGTFMCECGFEYYLTIDYCPLCGKSMRPVGQGDTSAAVNRE